MIRALLRSALMDVSTLLQWGIEKLIPDDPTPLGVLRRSPESDGLCEDCDGVCAVCDYRPGATSVEELSDEVRARYFAPRNSGFGASGAYHPRADWD